MKYYDFEKITEILEETKKLKFKDIESNYYLEQALMSLSMLANLSEQKSRENEILSKMMSNSEEENEEMIRNGILNALNYDSLLTLLNVAELNEYSLLEIKTSYQDANYSIFDKKRSLEQKVNYLLRKKK